MAKVMSGDQKDKMQDDVVCISDDDEKEEEKALNAATNKMRNLAFNYNVYENSYYVPESTRRQLELIDKQPASKQELTETVVYVPDDDEEEILLIGPLRNLSRQILFGNKLIEQPVEFPHSILHEMELQLATSLRNVSLSTESTVWEYTIAQLSCIRLSYSRSIDVSVLFLVCQLISSENILMRFVLFACVHLQLKIDEKYNLILIRILGQYINFRSRMTAANKTLGKDETREICKDIWLQLEVMLSNNFIYIILVLLRTDAMDYPLDVVLYHLFEKAHELMLHDQHLNQTFPRILVFIITVLFYKHWLLMFTEKEDRERHIECAKLTIRKFQKLPNNIEVKYKGFIRRIDDRILQCWLYKTTA